MAKKSKRFRIGVEGATTDGRTIERVWLTQMAANYNPQVYTAVVNMEHIKGYTPDSSFRRFGIVEKVEAEEISEGPLKGKMALYGWIVPTDELVSMTEKLQKTFTSMEVNPKFSDTGEAYLVGLAVTDDPASLGTEMLQFSAKAAVNPLARRKQAEGNLFTATEETTFEFEDVQGDKPGLFTRVKELLSRKASDDSARFADVHLAVEEVAGAHQKLSDSVGAVGESVSDLKVDFSKRLDDMQQKLGAAETEISNLREQLNREQPNSEALAADLIISQKRIGGLAAVQAPFFPANAILITRLDNLSIYWLEESRRRSVIDNPKRDRVENFESVNEAYVVEDYDCVALIENIEVLESEDAQAQQPAAAEMSDEQLARIVAMAATVVQGMNAAAASSQAGENPPVDGE